MSMMTQEETREAIRCLCVHGARARTHSRWGTQDLSLASNVLLRRQGQEALPVGWKGSSVVVLRLTGAKALVVVRRDRISHVAGALRHRCEVGVETWTMRA